MDYYDGVERREFLRVDYEAPVEIEVWQKDVVSKLPQAMSKNVSACGVLFTSRTSLAIGGLIAIKLDPHTLTDVVEIDDSVIEVNDKLVGRIVRVEEIIPEKEFDIGVCFVRKTEADDEDVRQVIQILTQEKE